MYSEGCAEFSFRIRCASRVPLSLTELYIFSEEACFDRGSTFWAKCCPTDGGAPTRQRGSSFLIDGTFSVRRAIFREGSKTGRLLNGRPAEIVSFFGRAFRRILVPIQAMHG